MEDQGYTTTTTTTHQSYSPGLNTNYLKSRDGILKIVEIVLSLITFICSISHLWYGHGWVEFVSISAFITTGIYLLFHILGLLRRFPGPWLLIEFIYYLVFAVFFLIAAIVAVARAGDSYYAASVAATAFFAFACTVVYAVDTVFQFRSWRFGFTHSSGSAGSPSTIDQPRSQY